MGTVPCDSRLFQRCASDPQAPQKVALASKLNVQVYSGYACRFADALSDWLQVEMHAYQEPARSQFGLAVTASNYNDIGWRFLHRRSARPVQIPEQ